MTTYKGIAVATQVLVHLAEDALERTVAGARVTTAPPAHGESEAEPRLNIYLLDAQAGPSRPGLALSLRFLFSYFGPHPHAQLMAGAVEGALHEHPVLTTSDVEAAVADQPDLSDSQLDLDTSPLRILRDAGSPEDLWRGLFPVPYVLSSLYSLSPLTMGAA